MIKRILVIVMLAVSGAWAVRRFVMEGVWVASGSMEPTLPVGTHYFVNKTAYRFQSPKRGEMVVFADPVDNTKGLIKRIIAVGGDTVGIRNKKVILNGEPLEEPYAVYKRPGDRLFGDNIAEMTVPAEHFFVMGDNRDESEDSSTWKNSQTKERVFFIRLDDIEGRLFIP